MIVKTGVVYHMHNSDWKQNGTTIFKQKS